MTSKHHQRYAVENTARLSRIARLIAEHQAITGAEFVATSPTNPADAAELNRLVGQHAADLSEEGAAINRPVPGFAYAKFVGGAS